MHEVHRGLPVPQRRHVVDPDLGVQAGVAQDGPQRHVFVAALGLAPHGIGKHLEAHLAADPITVFKRRLATDIRIRPGTKTLRDRAADLQHGFSCTAFQRLSVGVGHDEFDPIEVLLDHVVHGVAAGAADAALVGEESVPEVHVYENHSSALIAWRRAGVRGRILVHLDGHIDYDWLPDETVARIAAASPDELPDLEHHPYAMDGEAYSRFGIWRQILGAIAAMALLQSMGSAMAEAARSDATLWPLHYAPQVVGTVLIVGLLWRAAHPHAFRRRPAVGAP